MSDDNRGMYPKAKTWNPFKGCLFWCTYCGPTFQRQAKRIGDRCKKCYRYRPHFHEERLENIPSSDIVFVCGSGDISFATDEQVTKIIDRIKEHLEYCPDKTFYFQSKDPKTFERFKDDLPIDNCVLLTTLETNIPYFTNIYKGLEKPPGPLKRAYDFQEIDYPRKVVTVEPVMQFTTGFPSMMARIQPEYVWLGFNSKPEKVHLCEPTEEKVQGLIRELMKRGIEVRGKELRGCYIPDEVMADE